MDAPAAPVRRGFDLVAYLKLFRFPLVFTAIADSATGSLLVSGQATPAWPTLGLLAIASAGLYFFGMSLNDIADRKRDQELAPGRVLPSGRLTLRSAVTACAVALGCSLAAVLFIPRESMPLRLAAWGAVVIFIAAYNMFLKIPPAMGLVRASNLLLGILATLEGPVSPDQWKLCLLLAAPALIYVTALTYVSTLEDTGVKNARLIAGAAFMIVGAGLASFILPLQYYLGFISPGNPVYLVQQMPISWRANVLSGVLTLWILRRAWKAVDKKGVMLLVRDGVGGIIVLDATLLASVHPVYENTATLWPFAVAALVLPAIVSVAIFKRLA